MGLRRFYVWRLETCLSGWGSVCAMKLNTALKKDYENHRCCVRSTSSVMYFDCGL